MLIKLLSVLLPVALAFRGRTKLGSKNDLATSSLTKPAATLARQQVPFDR